MRQTNVCLNYCKYSKFYVKFVSQGLIQTLVLAKKVCYENRKKETKKEKNDGHFIQDIRRK